MTTLISYSSETHQVEGLANFLQSLGTENLSELCFEILSNSDKRQKDREIGVLTKLLESQELLWKKANEREIESFYYIISLLLKKIVGKCYCDTPSYYFELYCL